MEIKKMTLANLKGIMSRQEMKNVKAGDSGTIMSDAAGSGFSMGSGSGIVIGSGSGSYTCTCGTQSPSNNLRYCTCLDYCAKKCNE